MTPRDAAPLPHRRAALRAGLAAAGGLALGRAARSADTPPPGPYGPFKMGIQSYSLRHYPFEKALELTHELGLKYWESFSAHTPIDANKAAQAQTDAEKAGVDIVGFGVVRMTRDADANRAIFQFAKVLGAEYVSIDPDPDSFDVLDKLTEEFDIPVGIHPHGPGHRWDTIDKIAGAIKDHSDEIGICLDTGHLLRSGQDPVRAVEVFDKRIYGVHLKDVKDATTFTVLGRGDLRTADLLKALAGRKYSYCLALEYEENPEDPIADIRACLDAVKQAAPKA
jgi:sugar phosphate isomerase/epimerase